jgi:hypothetical protein
MAKKAKVQFNGAEVEVELPDGWLSPEEADTMLPKAIMATEVARAVTQAVKTGGYVKPDDLLGDDDFKAKALAAWKVQNPGKGAPTGAELEQLQRDWTAQHVKPVTDERDALKDRVSRLLSRSLHSSILEAARAAGVKDAYLRLPTGAPADAVPPIVSMFGSLFGYDEKTDAHYVRSGESFAYSGKPTAENPFKGVGEWFTEWSASKDNAEFLVDPRQRGPGLGDAPRGGAGGTITITLTRAQASDASQYQAARELAQKSGGSVQVVD